MQPSVLGNFLKLAPNVWRMIYPMADKKKFTGDHEKDKSGLFAQIKRHVRSYAFMRRGIKRKS